MTLLDLLAEPIARFILIPFMTCFIDTLINYSSLNDNNREFSWQLCRWGTGLITTNFLLIVTDMGTKAQYNQVSNEYLSNTIIALFVTSLLAVFMSLVARSHTYSKYYDGVREVPVSVILVSDLLGAISLVISYAIIY